MATSGRRFCDICHKSHVTIDATVWCPECDEYFCIKCKTHHDVAKATKKHETISTENALKLPNHVINYKINCTDHDERFVYFCRDHELPCCIKCLNDRHMGCRNLIPVETVIQDVKQSPSFLDLQTTLSDLLFNISTIVEDQKANLHELARQKVICADQIRLTRDAINSYLDELEKEFNNKMRKAFAKKEIEIQTSLADLDVRKDQINEIHANVNLIRDVASDFQTFMSIPEYIKSAHSEETALQSLCESNSYNWKSISVIPINIQSIKDNLASFGTISIKRKASHLNLKVQKSRQAQRTGTGMVSEDMKTIRFEEKFRHRIPATKNKHEIFDCGILPNGQLLFSDSSSKYLFKYDGVFSKMDLSFMPARFAIIDDYSIAATSENEMHIVNLNTKNSKSFDFGKGSRLGSVMIYDKNYIVEDLTGFIVLDFIGNIIKQVPIKFDELTYRAPVCIDHKIYFVDNKSNKVFCYDYDGNKIWEFQNEKLISPYGLTSNNSNILFVCGYRSNNVCALSVDGKTLKEIIGPKSELKCATAVHYCVKRKELLVVTSYGNFFVFSDK